MSQYCQPSDITTYAIPATAIPASVTVAQQIAACVAASQEVDNYIGGRYPLPLAPNFNNGTSYDPALVRHTAYIAAFILMSNRGFQPNAGADALISENYWKAVGYPDRPGSGFFPNVRRQNIDLNVSPTAVTPPKFNLPQVWTKRPRGI